MQMKKEKKKNSSRTKKKDNTKSAPLSLSTSLYLGSFLQKDQAGDGTIYLTFTKQLVQSLRPLAFSLLL